MKIPSAGDLSLTPRRRSGGGSSAGGALEDEAPFGSEITEEQTEEGGLFGSTEPTEANMKKPDTYSDVMWRSVFGRRKLLGGARVDGQR